MSKSKPIKTTCFLDNQLEPKYPTIGRSHGVRGPNLNKPCFQIRVLQQVVQKILQGYCPICENEDGSPVKVDFERLKKNPEQEAEHDISGICCNGPCYAPHQSATK